MKQMLRIILSCVEPSMKAGIIPIIITEQNPARLEQYHYQVA